MSVKWHVNGHLKSIKHKNGHYKTFFFLKRDNLALSVKVCVAVFLLCR